MLSSKGEAEMKTKEYAPRRCSDCLFCEQGCSSDTVFCSRYNEVLDWDASFVEKGKPDYCKVTRIIVEEKDE